MHIKQLQKSLLAAFHEQGLKTTVSIAKLAKMNQSTVYRSLYGSPKTVTRHIKELCKYANIDNYLEKPNPADNKLLITSLQNVWDGSDKHAKHISDLLFHVYLSAPKRQD